MKNLFLLLLAPLLFTSCSKLLGSSGEYTFTGTLYKDCDRTPLANAKIVYTTFRGSGFSPLTRSFNSETDANGRFAIKEASDGLQSITIELAQPPEYEAGPVIGRMNAGPVPNDVTHDFGELFYAKRGVDVGGDADFEAKLRIKIDPYFQQFDSLIIGMSDWPLILSPVPLFYEHNFTDVGGVDFVPLYSSTQGTITWCSSLLDYRRRYSPPTGANIFKRSIEFALCNQGQPIEFSIDTFARAKQ